MAVWRRELGENDLDEELLHLLLVDWLLKQDVRHGADHVQSPVLLTGRCAWGLVENHGNILTLQDRISRQKESGIQVT